jgi:decaprenyl-phosphate phosphoribosyltransferase
MIGAPAPDHEIGAGAAGRSGVPSVPAGLGQTEGMADANEVPDARELPAQTPGQADSGPLPPAARPRPSAHSLEVVSAPKQPLRSAVRALRPRQWTKNVLVFVAPAAAGVLFHRSVLLHSLGAFGIFCAAASGTYLLNDVLDVEADRLHPEKRHRPIASGSLSPAVALAMSAVLLAGSIALGWWLAGWELAVVIAAYVAISVSYSLWLKRVAVVELAAVAAGFVLRAIAGGVATHVPLSSWFLVVTSFGALFVVTGKRTAEFELLGPQRAEHRPALGDYTASFLKATLTLTATVTVTAYCLWAFERTGLADRAVGHHLVWIQLTVVPVVLGILHVLRLLDAGHGGAPEELALRDRLLQVLGLSWVALFLIGIYG